MTMVLSSGFKVQALRAKIPLLNTFQVSLFSNTPNLTRNTQTSDLTEPSYFTGVRKGPLVWGNPRLSNDGMRAVVSAPAVIWTGLLFIPATTVFGWFFLDRNGFYMFGDYFAGGPQKTAGPLPLISLLPLLYEDTMTLKNSPTP